MINWVIVTGQLHASTFCNSTINFRNCHFISGTFFAKYKLLSLLVRWSQNCHKLNKKAINLSYEKKPFVAIIKLSFFCRCQIFIVNNGMKCTFGNLLLRIGWRYAKWRGRNKKWWIAYCKGQRTGKEPSIWATLRTSLITL